MKSELRSLPARQRHGASIILIAVMLVVAFILSFWAIDLANLQFQHSKIQVVSDLSSKFGAVMTNDTNDTVEIQKYVDRIVDENLDFAGPRSSDHSFTTEYGSVDPETMVFKPGASPLNSVRVEVRTNLNTFGFMSRASEAIAVRRDATAASFHQDICVVVDRSSSMCYLDSADGVYPDDVAGNAMLTSSDPAARDRADEWWENWAHPTKTRWARLIDALYAMATEMADTDQDEFFSLVSYSHDHNMRFWNQQGVLTSYHYPLAELEAGPTFEYKTAIDKFARRYRTEKPVYGFTNITAGIEEGTRVLTAPTSRDNAFKTMVVMTDGQYNRGDFPGPAAEAAAAQGITIVTVTFGAGSDQETMREVAAAAHGKHFHADTGVELKKIFTTIARIPPGAIIE